MKQMMKSEEAARGFKRVDGLTFLGRDDVGGSDGGFAEVVGLVKPLASLPENFHMQLVIKIKNVLFVEKSLNQIKTYNQIVSIPRSFSPDHGRVYSWS